MPTMSPKTSIFCLELRFIARISRSSPFSVEISRSTGPRKVVDMFMLLEVLSSGLDSGFRDAEPLTNFGVGQGDGGISP